MSGYTEQNQQAGSSALRADPLLRWYAGRDWQRREGWVLHAALLPAERLMGRADEGRIILCGLGIALRLRWPWGRLSYVQHGETHGWRSFVSLSFRTDADEIAARIAGRTKDEGKASAEATV